MIKEQPSQEETRQREPGSILDRSAIRSNDPQQHARQRRANARRVVSRSRLQLPLHFACEQSI
jgi:hypothetical protein